MLGWTPGELTVAGGAAACVAACAETAGSVYTRFAADLAGLAAIDRASVALWDLRPLGAAVFALGALAVVFGLTDATPGAGVLRPALAVAAGGFAALGVVVLALTLWIGSRGLAGEANGLAVYFTGGERVATVVTQLAGWLPLIAFFVVLALRLTRTEQEALPAEIAGLVAEMDELWRQRLAFSPRRERGRALLERIRTLEAEGRPAEAEELAEEMRELAQQ